MDNSRGPLSEEGIPFLDAGPMWDDGQRIAFIGPGRVQSFHEPLGIPTNMVYDPSPLAYRYEYAPKAYDAVGYPTNMVYDTSGSPILTLPSSPE